MRNTSQRTVFTWLALATVLFAAGAVPAVAFEAPFDAAPDGGLFFDLLDRVGDFVSDVIGTVVEIIQKSGTEMDADG